MQQLWMVHHARHKCRFHLLTYNAITVPLTSFPVLYLGVLWFIHPITGTLNFPLPVTHFVHPPTGPSLLATVNSLHLWACFCFFSVCSFVPLFIFYIEVKSYRICLSLTDLFHLASYVKVYPWCCTWQDLILFYSCIIFHLCVCVCVCVYAFVCVWSVHVLVDTWVASISCQL